MEEDGRMAGVVPMKEAKKAEKALVDVERIYFFEAMNINDEEYIQAFNAIMKVLRRLQE